MLQLKNHTGFSPMLAVYPDVAGIDTLYVAVKASFRLGPPLAVSVDQAPINLADRFWGEPGQSSLKYAGEMHLAKPGTDVVLVGQAWAPAGRPVVQLDARLSVAGRQKLARITGNRVWRNCAPSKPEPFERMPLVYEYAYGGVHVVDPERQLVLAEERNPLGRGFAGKRKPEAFEGQPLPNIEDPQALLQKPGDASTPVCFGFVSPAWQPRRQYAGTYDEAWQTRRAPYLPADFDPRFFHAAHPDLIFAQYLQGGEPVELDNLSRRGPLRFNLPEVRLHTQARIAGRNDTIPMYLETVLIEPEEDRLSLLWRGALRCDKQALKIQQVDIHLHDLRINGKAA